MNEHTHKTCTSCQTFLPIKKFGISSGEYRRMECNRCHRASREAKKWGMTTKEYLSFSDGPCCFCGHSPASAYFLDSESPPIARVCQRHRLMFRSRRYLQELVVSDMLLEKFPFWLNFLKAKNVSLFKLEIDVGDD